MVRTYKPKTDRGSIDEENIKTAISEVISKRLSIRRAADKYRIKAATLQHRIEKFRKTIEENEASSSNIYGSKYTVAQVFSTEQEKVFSEYLLNCSKMHCGLSLQKVLVLAYEYAEYLGCKYPESWKKNRCAGKDWAAGFRKRNWDLSLRKPENTSAAQSFAFNKTAATDFFDNYGHVMTGLAFGDDDSAPIQIIDSSSQDIADVTDVTNEENTQGLGFVDMAINQNGEVVENCEGDEILVVEVDSLGNQLEEDVTLSSDIVPPGSTPILSPYVFKPYPKEDIGKNNSSAKKGREKGKSRLFTDMPEKDRLQRLHEQKERKQQVKMMKQKEKELKKAKHLLVLMETKNKKKRCHCSQSDSNTS